jgi:hypothetical protein
MKKKSIAEAQKVAWIMTVLVLAVIALIWTGCSKSGGTGGTGSPGGPGGGAGGTPAPTVTTVSPDSGAFNTTVTITGTNFSTNVADDQLSFNGVSATINSVTATQITAMVPKGAGTGTVNVTVKGRAVTGPIFTYLFTYTVSTLAGGSMGNADGTGTAAKFDYPFCIAVDTAGNVIVADAFNAEVRKITPAGAVTTLAGGSKAGGGYQDGPAATALFKTLSGVAVDAMDNILVADPYNYKLRQISPAGIVSTIAGSTAGVKDTLAGFAKFNSPSFVTVDAAGKIYILDGTLVRVLSGGSVSTLYDGHSYSSQISTFLSIGARQNNNLALVDDEGVKIYNLTTAGVFTVLAGAGAPAYQDGMGTSAYFSSASGVAIDGQGNIIVADKVNQRIRIVSPTGAVGTIAGSGTAGDADGVGSAAQFYYPQAVAVDKSGNIYVVEPMSNRIRKITAQ